MIRKVVKALLLIPLAIVIVAFAVANRQAVTVSFDPFNSAAPAFSLATPLYAVILAMVIVGVILGGVAAWLRQGRWRSRARSAESHVRELRAENEQLKRRDAPAQAATASAVDHGAHQGILPPVR